MKSIKHFRINRWTIPILLLGVVFITYGYQLWRMGLYWDDWEIIYLNHLGNSKAYLDYFQSTRSLTGWLYLLLSPIVGMKPIAWQTINMLLRWAGLVGFWWVLRLVWPKKSFEIGWVCLLMAVYPAFTQNSAAVTSARYFACIALFSLSLGLNLLALEKPGRWWFFTLAAVLASSFQLITLEYFVGLEILRPIFIWIFLRQQKYSWKTNITILLLQWFPYLLVLLIFAEYHFIWYPLAFPNSGVDAPIITEQFLSNPFSETIKYINLTLQYLLHLNVDNWLNPVEPDTFELRAKANWLSWGAAALITLICTWFLNKFPKEPGIFSVMKKEEDKFGREAVLIGLAGILAASLPVWVAGTQPVGLLNDWFVLGPMFGAVFMLVGLVHWFSWRRLQQSVLLGLIFGFALSSQMQTVNKYRLNWDHQKDYYWQLVWRAPAIKPGTAIVSYSLPFAFANDPQIGSALNAIYDQHNKSIEAPIWFFQAGSLQSNKPGTPIDFNDKTAHFAGTTDQLLVAEYSSGSSCLRIVTSEDRLRTTLQDNERILIGLSKPEMIELHPVKPAILPSVIFGVEPVHGWCYIYQKMEIARQEQNWSEAALLADEAGTQKMIPLTALEYTPVILAYINTGQPEKALEAALAAQKMDKDQTEYICSLWKTNLPVVKGFYDKAQSALQCSSPAAVEIVP